MTRIDYAAQRERDRRHAAKRDAAADAWLSGRQNEQRALKLLNWVNERKLKCFVCKQAPRYGEIAKTGMSKRGAWCLCVMCAQEGRNK